MKSSKLKIASIALVLALSSSTFAKGGMSSGSGGGGSRGGFSSAGSRPSTPSQSYSQPSRVNQPTPQRQTTTTTTTRSSYSSRVSGSGMMYGGMGMGYGYSNGLLTGLIIGNMMHPHGTVMYTGYGSYSNNALLYPNGQVVNQQGIVVGTYLNGSFTPVMNGGMVAQAVPSDAIAQPQMQPQPVVIQQSNNYALTSVLIAIAFFLVLILILV